MTKRLIVDSYLADFKDLAPAARVLLDGGVVAAPTESFYAFLALVDNPKALAKVHNLKEGRHSEKAFLILIEQQLRVMSYARDIPDESRNLMHTFWPGLLTLLFLAHPGLDLSIIGPARTVALRLEGLPIIRKLVRMVDRGVTGTSANLAGLSPCQTAEEVLDLFNGKVDMVLDGGKTKGGLASTIIDVSLGSPRLLRDGGLPLDKLLKACPILRI